MPNVSRSWSIGCVRLSKTQQIKGISTTRSYTYPRTCPDSQFQTPGEQRSTLGQRHGTGPSLRAAIAAWGVGNAADVDEATSPNPPDAVARAAERCGDASATGSADGPAAGGIRPTEPSRPLLSVFLEHAAQQRCQRLLSAEVPGATLEQIRRARARLRIAAGPSAGKAFTARLDWQGVAFSDKEWRVATAYRVGLSTRKATTLC